MKRKKLWRHIAILLSFCLVFTSMPAMAYGSNEADSESAPKEENQNYLRGSRGHNPRRRTKR